MTGAFILQGHATKVVQYDAPRTEHPCGCEATPKGKITLAGAGSYAKINKFFDWIADGAEASSYNEDDSMEGQFIMFNNGQLYTYEDYHEPLIIDTPMSIGSGSQFAMGAMMAGASPKEAVAIAMQLDPDTGGEIVEYEL